MKNKCLMKKGGRNYDSYIEGWANKHAGIF